MSKGIATSPPVGIVPEGRYPLKTVYDVTGISETRRRLACRDGVELETFSIGRRKFATGVAVIEYLDELGRLHEQKSC